jgi:hypothetical protein
LLLAAVFLLLKTREQRRLGGLPDGDLIYTDNVAGDCPVLVSHRYGLKGRPDALVRTGSGDLIPAERKKSRAPRHRPYDGDLIEATAYCILVEEEFGRTPPFMRIQHADRWFDERLHRPSWYGLFLLLCLGEVGSNRPPVFFRGLRVAQIFTGLRCGFLRGGHGKNLLSTTIEHFCVNMFTVPLGIEASRAARQLVPAANETNQRCKGQPPQTGYVPIAGTGPFMPTGQGRSF